jgi:hypothetical protein
MKFLALLHKTVLLKLRDPLSLLLTLFTPATFVVLICLLFSGYSINPSVAFLNETPVKNLDDLILQNNNKEQTNENNLKLIETSSIDEFNEYINSRKVQIGLKFFINHEKGNLVLEGIVSDPKYIPVREKIVQSISSDFNKNLSSTQALEIDLIGPKQDPLSLFFQMVPGLIVFSIIMMIFSTSVFVAKELKSNSMIRIKIAGISAGKNYFALTVVQILEGILALSLTILIAVLLGFSINAIGSVYFFSAIAVLGMIGIGMIIACLSQSVNQALLISSAVMFLFILFTGIIFPKPEIILFSNAYKDFYLFDFLPTGPLSNVINNATSSIPTINRLAYELFIIFLSSMFYFLLGLMAFRYRFKIV